MNKTHLPAVLLAVLALSAHAELSDGLVTWFSFDSADSNGVVENLADQSRPLTLVSGGELDPADSVSGSAIYFPGEFRQGATFSTPALTNCTMSFWYKRGVDDGPYVETNSVSLPYVIGGWSSVRMHLSRSNTTLAFVSNNDNTTLYAPSSAAMRNVWTHYTATFEETDRTGSASTVEVKLYIDGKFYGSAVKAMTTLHGGSVASTVTLGNLNVSEGARPSMFRMDEFRAWNRVLDADEAYEEYRRTAGSAPYSIIAHWSMDSISVAGDTRSAADDSGNGLDLQLGSAVTVTNDAVEGSALSFVNSTASWGKTASSIGAYILSDVTYSMWMRPAAVSSAPSPRIMEVGGGYVHADSSSTGYSLTMKPANITSGTLTFSGSTSPWCLEKGQWSHLAIVRRTNRLADGSYTIDVEVWCNGELKGVKSGVSVTGAFYSGETFLYLMSNGSSRPIDSLCDEVTVLKGALSTNGIRRLYAGAPAVSAGGSFSTAGRSAVLHGFVGPDTADPRRSGCGSVADRVWWSLVSAPAGGEGTVISSPESAETEVSLPVAGSYVFRLSASSMGSTRTSDVTVTRVSSPSGVLPSVTASAQPAVTLPMKGWLSATCSDPAARTWWSKASGPGGVWFDVDSSGAGHAYFSAAGVYVLSFNAENGAGASSASASVTVAAGEQVDVPAGSLEAGMLFNVNPVRKDGASAYSAYSYSLVDGSVARLEDGVKSLGMRMLQSLGSIMLRGGGWTWETKGDASVITTPEYMTFSAWIKYEPGTDPEGPSMPFVFVNHQAAALRVGRAVYSSSAGMRDGGDGLTLVQQGASGQTVGLTCDFSGMPSITGRWTHVCAVLPRVSGARDDFELWVDGVKRELSAVSGYASFPRPGRDINKKWQVGGYTNNTTAGSASYDQQLLKSNQGLFAFATNTVSGGFRSPVFPGVIDEVRFYSSRLSAAQIRALAMEPDANRNFAPFIDAPPAVPLTVRRNAALGLSLGVYDDGMPLGGALSCSWEVVSGNAAAVAFGDRSSASTTAAFFAVGEYALRLVADDGERKSFSAPVHVRVLPSGLIFMVR